MGPQYQTGTVTLNDLIGRHPQPVICYQPRRSGRTGMRGVWLSASAFMRYVCIGLALLPRDPASAEAIDRSASSPSSRQPPVSIIPQGRTFRCTPVAVYDGDGPIWCAEGQKIRVAGVAAREMDGSCQFNHPCPATGAIEARDKLVALFGGPRGKLATGQILVRSAPMHCVSAGHARGSRTAAWCRSPYFGDLSCAVVKAGGAVRWPRYWRQHRC